jgi:hypothetical protein
LDVGNRQLTARIVRHFRRAVHCELRALRQVKAAEEGGIMNAKPVKYRIRHGGYVSEFDHFIDDFMVQHPAVEADQRRGWYIWWDHRVDLKDLEKQHGDAVPVKSYQYD